MLKKVVVGKSLFNILDPTLTVRLERPSDRMQIFICGHSAQGTLFEDVCRKTNEEKVQVKRQNGKASKKNGQDILPFDFHRLQVGGVTSTLSVRRY